MRVLLLGINRLAAYWHFMEMVVGGWDVSLAAQAMHHAWHGCLVTLDLT